MKYIILSIFVTFSILSFSQSFKSQSINQNIIVNDSIIGVSDSLVYESDDNAILYITLFEKVSNTQLKILKSHYEELYACSITGKISYQLKDTQGIDITESNAEHFKKSGAYLQKASRISNSAIIILFAGSLFGGLAATTNPEIGVGIIIATAVFVLVQNIRTNKFLRKAGEELAKAK